MLDTGAPGLEYGRRPVDDPGLQQSAPNRPGYLSARTDQHLGTGRAGRGTAMAQYRSQDKGLPIFKEFANLIEQGNHGGTLSI